MGKYDYLQKYINNNSSEPNSNYFGLITLAEIKDAEQRLFFVFPESLKEFWLEIGYGGLTTSDNGKKTFNANRILFPEQIADIILLKEDSGYILPEYAELLEEGDIPFFAIADSASFLFMKRFAEDKDAIYDGTGAIVARNLEEFIRKLYYESPTFYLDIHAEEIAESNRQKKLEEEEIDRRLKASPPRGALWEYIHHNYHKIFRKYGIYEDLKFGGEPYAKDMVARYKDEFILNYCPSCGHLKKTPLARQCLECMEFHDPSSSKL